MFDFERLDVYTVVKDLIIKLNNNLELTINIDETIKEQLKSTTVNVIILLAEGMGRNTNSDKRHFLSQARGNVFKAVALLDVIRAADAIEDNSYHELYEEYEKSSKMLLGMIKSYQRKSFNKED